jgi:hypothetical protein
MHIARNSVAFPEAIGQLETFLASTYGRCASLPASSLYSVSH